MAMAVTPFHVFEPEIGDRQIEDHVSRASVKAETKKRRKDRCIWPTLRSYPGRAAVTLQSL
jgi:hypothetical protein